MVRVCGDRQTHVIFSAPASRWPRALWPLCLVLMALMHCGLAPSSLNAFGLMPCGLCALFLWP
jgi:hypothetical protein